MLNKMGGLKDIESRTQAQAYNATKEEETIPEKANPIIMADQLNAVLKTIQDGTCSRAQAGICLNSESLMPHILLGIIYGF